MEKEIQHLLNALNSGEYQFSDVLAFIDRKKEHQPTAFKNGDIHNDPNQNQGSARVFLFAKENAFSKENTLSLFAEHYKAVLADREGANHQNIRQFMKYGWDGVEFYSA